MQEGDGPTELHLVVQGGGGEESGLDGRRVEEAQRRVSAVRLGPLAGVDEGHQCWAVVVQGTGDQGSGGYLNCSAPPGEPRLPVTHPGFRCLPEPSR